jgi:hypothetical protein
MNTQSKFASNQIMDVINTGKSGKVDEHLAKIDIESGKGS